MMRSSSVDRSVGVRAVWGSFVGTTGLISNVGSSDWTITRSGVGVYIVTVAPGFKTTPTCGGSVGSFGVLGFSIISYNQVQIFSWVPSTQAALDAPIYFRLEGKAL